jgi:hypothetical protein
MITVQTLRSMTPCSIEVLKTVKNGKAYYYLKTESDSKFSRISKAVYHSLDLFSQSSCNFFTEVRGDTCKQFKSMFLI